MADLVTSFLYEISKEAITKKYPRKTWLMLVFEDAIEEQSMMNATNVYKLNWFKYNPKNKTETLGIGNKWAEVYINVPATKSKHVVVVELFVLLSFSSAAVSLPITLKLTSTLAINKKAADRSVRRDAIDSTDKEVDSDGTWDKCADNSMLGKAIRTGRVPTRCDVNEVLRFGVRIRLIDVEATIGTPECEGVCECECECEVGPDCNEVSTRA
ncbi:hypothetical protein CLIB1423_03S05666 [[Candida] railenensis]|uniref:Uncharacterized protein n=1 Tax=[Candida] railenensis TaxID=45579 RepID=A0A9P0VWL2_9ASCO|nr:hypothetical protein CLIB1423_03S05666 [[Candida] railenensis]